MKKQAHAFTSSLCVPLAPTVQRGKKAYSSTEADHSGIQTSSHAHIPSCIPDTLNNGSGTLKTFLNP
jgi:hypothetical protein